MRDRAYRWLPVYYGSECERLMKAGFIAPDGAITPRGYAAAAAEG